jgi:Family of unknown function (DUF6069)
MTAIANVQQYVTSSTRRTRAAAVGTAVVADAALYLAGRALGVGFELTDPGATKVHQLILPEIVVFTAVFALLGWGSLALLERFTHHARTVWTALAGAVLVLSLFPIFIEQADAGTRTALVIIHLTVAAALTPLLRSRR